MKRVMEVVDGINMTPFMRTLYDNLFLQCLVFEHRDIFVSEADEAYSNHSREEVVVWLERMAELSALLNTLSIEYMKEMQTKNGGRNDRIN